MIAPTPDESGPNDLELRGTPPGLQPFAELLEANPDSTFVGAYSRISDDWRAHSKKKATTSAWSAGKGVANQHRRNDKNAARHRLIITHRYTDNDLSASKLDGLPHSGPRPFGWEEDKLTLRKPESDFLAWAIRERIKGKALSTLCAEAERRGLRGSRGGKIVNQTLTQMMTAPRVCGYRANRGVLALDEHDASIVGKWQTIVTPVEWEVVCATFGAGSTYLARGSGTPSITGVPKTVKYLASALLKCMVRSSATGRPGSATAPSMEALRNRRRARTPTGVTPVTRTRSPDRWWTGRSSACY
jgi:hypothetical protein